MSKNSYTNFEIKAEFWVDADANSGIFIRCEGVGKKSPARPAYEVNIFDKRPDPSYATGAIVGLAKSATLIKAADKWNNYRHRGPGALKFTVTLYEIKTVDGASLGQYTSEWSHCPAVWWRRGEVPQSGNQAAIGAARTAQARSYRKGRVLAWHRAVKPGARNVLARAPQRKPSAPEMRRLTGAQGGRA